MITAQPPWSIRYNMDGSASLLDRSGTVFALFNDYRNAELVQNFNISKQDFDKDKEKLEDTIEDLEGEVEYLKVELKNKSTTAGGAV